MVKVPLYKEGLQVKTKCTLENAFVFFVPSLETHNADPGCSSSIYLLEMETGKLALLTGYSNHEVVDSRSRRVYKMPYQGKCPTAGTQEIPGQVVR